CNLLGIWCSVVLASLYGYQNPILLGGIGLILLHVYLVFAMPETNFTPTPRQERTTFRQMMATLSEGVSAVRTSSILLLLMVTELIAGAASEGFDRLVEAHYLQNLNMPVLTVPVLGELDLITWFAIWNIAAVTLGLTVIEVARRRLKTDHPVQAAKTLMTLDAVIVVSTILFGLTRSFAVAFAAELLRHTCRQLGGPIRNAWLNQNLPSSIRATVISLNSQANAFGQMAGGPGVGWVGNRFGLRAALTVAGVLLMPTVALYGQTIRQQNLRSLRPAVMGSDKLEQQ
ncbi:MAG: hypothetical protein DCC55_41250, partial [Chloroflexi bacterium]